MSIAIPSSQLDARLDEGIWFRCDACEESNGVMWRQGEGDGRIFTVSISPGLQKDRFADDVLNATVDVHLCRDHVRRFRQWITWGVMFCPHCNGIVERTGRTRPIENCDGVWEEFQCENTPAKSRSQMHYHEWDPLD